MPIVNLRGTLEAEAAQTPLSTLMSIIGTKGTNSNRRSDVSQ